jgi:hypothetical protein
MLYIYRYAPTSFVLNWYTPTPTATNVKRNIQLNSGPSVGKLALMKVIHEDSAKLDKHPAEQVSKIENKKRRVVRKTHPDIAVDDEADAK